MKIRGGMAVLVLILLLLACASPVAGSDELKRVLLRDIISLNSPVFGDYKELVLAKAKTQAVIQGMHGSAVTEDCRNWVDLFIAIVKDFDAMTALSKNDDPSYHREAIKKAEMINESIYELRAYDIPESNGIPLLLELALKRFYRREGSFFQDIAADTAETKLKIEYEYLSATTYALGGMHSDATRMEFEARHDERVYDRDMARARAYMEDSERHLHNATQPALFGAAFMEILRARDSFERAKRIYEKHSDPELDAISAKGAEIDAVYRRLMLDTLKIVAVYLLILLAITVVLWWDFRRWSEELEDTRLGIELIGQ